VDKGMGLSFSKFPKRDFFGVCWFEISSFPRFYLFFFSVDGFILMFLLEQKIRLFWKIVERARTPKEISLSFRETTSFASTPTFAR